MKEGETTNDLFAFLTSEPNAEVGAVHPKAMPVILTTFEEVEQWLTAPTAEALALQRPLPDGSLSIVARGTRKDAPDEAAVRRPGDTSVDLLVVSVEVVASDGPMTYQRFPALRQMAGDGGFDRDITAPYASGGSRLAG